MNEFQVRQIDASGHVVSEKLVTAHDYGAVLRQLKEVDQEAERIEVYNDEGKKSGEVCAKYLRQKRHR